jgi:hypothetical protein
MITLSKDVRSQEFTKNFESAKDGQIFEYENRKFIKLTGMVAFELETKKRYFRALDF